MNKLCIRLVSFFIVLVIAALRGPAGAADSIKLLSASVEADRAFPSLSRFVIGGWLLRDEFGLAPPYAEEIKPGAYVQGYVLNSGSQPAQVTAVLLDGIDLAKHIVPDQIDRGGIQAASYHLNKPERTPKDVAARLDEMGEPLWYQVRPNPVPPGGVAEVTVRLRRVPAAKSLSVGVTTAGGASQKASASPAAAPRLRIASVNFDKAIGRIYLYLRHEDGKEFRLKTLQLDGVPVSLPAGAWLDSQSAFLPVEAPLPKAWEYGSFHYVAATAEDGSIARAVVRARDDFYALGMWGYRHDGNSPEERARGVSRVFAENLFNTHMRMAGEQSGFLVSGEGMKMLDGLGMRVMSSDPNPDDIRNPIVYCRFLYDEPDAHDYSVSDLPNEKRLGSLAQGVVERQAKWSNTDRRTLCLLNIDNTYKVDNWITYGRLADINCLDPYYMGEIQLAYNRHPARLPQYTQPMYVWGAAEIARWTSEPRPTHVILCSTSYRSEEGAFRFPTPEENRMQFYLALGAGAKGISYWWFTPYDECYGVGADVAEAKALLRNMAELNAEARAVLPLLARSCPGAVSGTMVDPFVATRPFWLMSRTLFSGTDTAIVTLINREVLSDRQGTVFKLVPKAPLTLTLPGWLKPASAFRVGPAGIAPVELKPEGGKYSAELLDIDIAEMLVITSNPSLMQEVSGRWQEIQPRLKAATAGGKK